MRQTNCRIFFLYIFNLETLNIFLFSPWSFVLCCCAFFSPGYRCYLSPLIKQKPDVLCPDTVSCRSSAFEPQLSFEALRWTKLESALQLLTFVTKEHYNLSCLLQFCIVFAHGLQSVFLLICFTVSLRHAVPLRLDDFVSSEVTLADRTH